MPKTRTEIFSVTLNTSVYDVANFLTVNRQLSLQSSAAFAGARRSAAKPTTTVQRVVIFHNC